MPHLDEQRATFGTWQRIVPEYDARPTRQRGDARKQVVDALVGHQPEAWEVAAGHRGFYSAAVSPAERLADINAQVGRAAARSGRSAADVTLIAVSKTYDAEAIRPFVDDGHIAFGENRVAEATGKWPALCEGRDLELHLVGQLQSNKAEDAARLFDVIHSLDRASLVAALARARNKVGRVPDCFVQVDLADEPQKGGVAVAGLPALLAEAQAAALPVVGLMCVPPLEREPAPWFAFLAKLAADNGLAKLSMGMSGDFESAITLGATHVRIGTALFGARE